MFGNTIKLKMTHDEIRVLVFALNELRNSLIEEGRYTDAVDELLMDNDAISKYDEHLNSM